MSNLDPMEPRPNPPRYTPPDEDKTGMGGGALALALLAAVIVCGLIFYTVSGNPPTTASNSPPSTVGQGGSNANPSPKQDAPNPPAPPPAAK
jgi:hypothetical protein